MSVRQTSDDYYEAALPSLREMRSEDIARSTPPPPTREAGGQQVSRMRQYIALIHKDADSDFGVSFPDLPGCITAGTNLDDARAMATEALAFHLEGLVADGEAVPEPSSLEEIMSDEKEDGSICHAR